MKKTETIIVSDIHLGSRVSRAKQLIKLLKSYSFKRLILLGDIFEDLNFGKITEDQWALLSYIRNISHRAEVVWIEGNHDKGLSDIMSALVGIKAYKRYTWQYKRKKCIAIHGHQFDRFLINNLLLSYLATYIYNLIQRIDFENQTISRYIKKRSKMWMRSSQKVTNSAIFYAKFTKAKYIFCGHTHQALELKKFGVNYYNAGCWTDIPSTYITMDDKEIKIHDYY